MRGNSGPGDLVYHWRAGTGVHQAQDHWLRPARVIGIGGGNVWVSHRATPIECAKEQLRMASPAEREMREMLMRIGRGDVPRQQDLTQQQPPPVSAAKTATKTGSKATAVSSRTRTTREAGGAKTGTSTPATGVWTESGTTADTTTETTSSSAR